MEDHTDDWQSQKDISESNLHMLRHSLYCDVTFTVGTDDSTCRAIKAHKYMLTSRSCVFETMFEGSLVESGTVRVPDIDPDIFLQMLEFIYTGLVEVEKECVLALMYAAKKYCITGLVNKCVSFMSVIMLPENACNLMEQAHLFNETELLEKALKLILEEGDSALSTDYFPQLCRDCVMKIISSNDLVVSGEIVVFEAMKKWAENVGQSSDMDIKNDLTLREILGRLLYQVRFPILSPCYFRKAVAGSNLLSDEEKNDVLMGFIFPDKSSQFFVDHPRAFGELMKEVWRLPVNAKTVVRSSRRIPDLKYYDEEKMDAISFISSKDVWLHGFKLYGRSDGFHTYKIMFHVWQHGPGNSETDIASSEIEVQTNNIDPFLSIIFKDAKLVKGWCKYTLGLTFCSAGAATYYGKRDSPNPYNSCFECNEGGVDFLFIASAKDTNGSGPAIGQMPTLLYTVA